MVDANQSDKHQNTVKSIALYIANEHPEMLDYFVEQQRHNLSNMVRRFHKNTVAYGPFKGMRLCEEVHWGVGDRAAMILGLYEQEILEALSTLTPRRKVFVDLGAADGYYGVGVLVNNLFEKAYCFEMTEKGREIIAVTAELNGVTGRLEIRGEATETFHQDLPEGELDESVLLVDIEGCEFFILNQGTFEAFSKAVIIVEVHEWIQDAALKLDRLKLAADKTHTVQKLTMSQRDLSGFPELASLSDTNRWLLCSEGRPELMSWLRFDPRL